VALSSGPGSFTGLRIGASTVKGLLTPDIKPFVLIPTFDGISASYLRENEAAESHMICLDAKQDEWYVQKYGPDGSGGRIEILETSKVLPQIGTRVVLTDVPGQFGGYEHVSDLRRWCSGAVIAGLGRAKIEQGIRDDVRSFEPSYWKEFAVRKAPNIVTPVQRVKEK